MAGSHHHEPAFVQGEARYEESRKVTVVGAVVNVLLSVIKILAGWLGSSHALIADWLPPEQIDNHIAGLILLAAAPCTRPPWRPCW